MKKTLSKNITFYIGALAVFVAGVLYMFLSDLSFKNTADRLIVAVLLAFAGAILFFLSLSFNERPVLMYLFKALGIVFAAGFIVYIHIFSQSEYYLGQLAWLEDYGIKKATEFAMAKATIIVTLILGYLSLVAQITNTVLVATVKEN